MGRVFLCIIVSCFNLFKFIAIWMLEIYYAQALTIKHRVLRSKRLLSDRADNCLFEEFTYSVVESLLREPFLLILSDIDYE